MLIKEITDGGLFLSDGTKIMDTKAIGSIDFKCESLEKEESETVNMFSNSFSGEFTLEGCELNESLLNQLSISPLSFKVPYAIPVRTHKKKRIFKKWLKQYGVKVDYLILYFQIKTYDSGESEWELTKESLMIFNNFIKRFRLYEYVCNNNVIY